MNHAIYTVIGYSPLCIIETYFLDESADNNTHGPTIYIKRLPKRSVIKELSQL